MSSTTARTASHTAHRTTRRPAHRPDAVSSYAPEPTTPTLRRGRALHLVDLENALGTGDPTHDDVARFWDLYRRLVGPDDLVVVATSHHAAQVAWFALAGTGVRLLVRSGQDGADTALIDDVDLPHMAARIDWLVVVSGDHAFVPLLWHAHALGLHTWQVTGIGRPSRHLQHAAQLHTQLKLQTAPVAASIPA